MDGLRILKAKNQGESYRHRSEDQNDRVSTLHFAISI